MRCTRWPGQSRLVQNVSLSPGAAAPVGPRSSGRRWGTSTGGGLRAWPPRHRAHHLGDHVAGLAHHHRVAGPHVLGPHLVLVVEGGQRHGGAADEDRLQHGERGGLAGPTDRDRDVLQRGGPLLGRELVGDGPPRGPGRGAELALQGQVVDLDHHAVDLVVELVTVLLPPAAEGQRLVEAVDHLAFGVDREPGRGPATRGWRAWVGASSPGAEIRRPPGRPGSSSPTW